MRRFAAIVISLNLWLLNTGPSVHGQTQFIERLPPPATPDLEVDADVPPPSVGDIGNAPELEPAWYDPWNWIGPRLWEGSFEFGINGSEGNAQSLSLRTGGKLTRETDKSKSILDVTYAKTQSQSIETQHNALLDGRVDWKLGESPWSLFNRLNLEYDEFKAFDVRVRLSGGLGYKIIDRKTVELAGRFGAGSSREFGGGDEEWIPEANFGLDFEQHISARQKLTGTIDYYPAWEDFTDYRLVMDAGWEILLDEEKNMSLKIGVIDRYDNTPNGAEPNDIDYSALLIWKL